MTSDQVIELSKQVMVTTAKLALPFLVVVLGIGLAIGLIQSLTQLQEQTLTFVPKLLGCAVVIALAGNWMLVELVNFGRMLLENANTFIGR